MGGLLRDSEDPSVEILSLLPEEIKSDLQTSPLIVFIPTCRAYGTSSSSSRDRMMIVVERLRLKWLPAFPY